jgi:hypothetical protein
MLNSKGIINRFILIFLFFIFADFRIYNTAIVPIQFKDFGVEIIDIPKLGDTLFYNKSSKEDFKFIFFDCRGKCYCERFIDKKLYQKGSFENSLDTLRGYVSGRNSNGHTSSIKVKKYFEPLKNGEWVTYKNNKVVKEYYKMGISE